MEEQIALGDDYKIINDKTDAAECVILLRRQAHWSAPNR